MYAQSPPGANTSRQGQERRTSTPIGDFAAHYAPQLYQKALDGLMDDLRKDTRDDD